MTFPDYEALVRVARRVSAAWAEIDRDVDAFPSVVLAETADLDLSYFGDIANLHALTADPRVAELQRASTFSDLYYKLYDDGHYWVEVLNWWASDVNIHDHDFSGVQFQLAGRSLNVVYKFFGDEPETGFQTGRFEVAQATVWQPGESSLVVAGDLEPHSVCHLDVPTVSLLFRTHPIPSMGPQNNYFPPDVRGSYKVATLAFRTRLKILRMLARSRPDDFRRTFWETVPQQTKQANLFTIAKLADLIFTPRYQEVLTEFAQSDIDGAATIVAAVGRYRTADHLKSAMRGLANEDGSASLALAVLASSWDSPSVQAISSQLSAAGYETDVERALAEAAGEGLLGGEAGVRGIRRRFAIDA